MKPRTPKPSVRAVIDKGKQPKDTLAPDSAPATVNAWRVTRARRCTVGLMVRDFQVGDVLPVRHYDARVIESLRQPLRLVPHDEKAQAERDRDEVGDDVVAFRLLNRTDFIDGSSRSLISLPRGHVWQRHLMTADTLARVRQAKGKLQALTAAQLAEPWEAEDGV